MAGLRLSTRRLSFVAGLLALLGAVFAVADPVAAHVVQVTTAIDISNVKSPHDFERALQAAVEQAAKEAIAFEPTIVALTGARVLGDKVLVSVLFADDAGKAILEAMHPGSTEGDDDLEVKPTKITI